ncbi:unnamed protein product [Brachionus calyciflorus]|uniref:Uncharacterized protein n=1 Tax=Brachionus calyciflorus TaxID=104777 RepID=A0A814QMP2_9BILA|nr:unnamed protein product [Brachionus calyciflorus]
MDKSFEDDEDVIDNNHSNENNENLILYESNSRSYLDENEVETKQLSKHESSFVSSFSTEKQKNMFLKDQQLRTRVTQTNNGYNCTCDDQMKKIQNMIELDRSSSYSLLFSIK